jgi:hypothetical protein
MIAAHLPHARHFNHAFLPIKPNSRPIPFESEPLPRWYRCHQVPPRNTPVPRPYHESPAWYHHLLAPGAAASRPLRTLSEDWRSRQVAAITRHKGTRDEQEIDVDG